MTAIGDKLIDLLLKENGELKTKLAERNVLLREAYEAGDHNVFGTDLDERIKAAISASAEPSSPKFGVLAGEPEIIGERCKDGGTCHHGCTQTCFRRLNCGALTGSGLNPDWSEPTAPVEIDERAAFEKEFPVPGGVRFLEADNCYVDERLDYEGGGSYQPAWEAWQARAALERKL